MDERKQEGELHLLGGSTVYKQDYAPEVLEAFTNKHQGNDYWVRFNCPEFMKDLIKLMDPKYIEVTGIFTPRGGISIYPYCNYGRPNTKFEQLAEKRLFDHNQ